MGKRIKYDYREQIDRLDSIMAPYLHPDFFFLNIGACDGVMGDPVYPLVCKYHWAGIAIEPVPHNFARLEENYRGEPQVILENAAISREPQTFWFVGEGSDSLHHVVAQIGSLSREHVLRNLGRLKIMAAGRPLPRVPHHMAEHPPVGLVDYDDEVNIADDVEAYVQGIDVPCFTIDELLDKHGVDSVDYINIDAEGADYEIFSMIDFERIRPGVLVIETTSFDDETSTGLADELADLGYEFVTRYGMFSEVWVDPRS